MINQTRKIIIITANCLLLTSSCFSQAPEIEWQNTIASNGYDRLKIVEQTTDGGYILGGSTDEEGISGDKTVTGEGGYDYWILKLDSIGNIEWQNIFGGSESDHLNVIHQTNDGGYIAGGWSMSGISGDKTEALIGGWGDDYWILKLNPEGNIEWQNTIGGNSEDELSCLQQTNDGGYILGGWSNSDISGDKTSLGNGYRDYWVVKLNSAGNIQWQNSIGGGGQDYLNALQQTNDDGYILGGRSDSSMSGDKGENSNGLWDYWVVKINAIGAIEWENTIGGNKTDELYSLQQTNDNGYIIGGFSFSNISGDKTEGNLGPFTSDYWVIKLNSSGNIEWQNTIGGSNNDYLYNLQQTSDGGYIIGGHSHSGISGDKTEISMGGFDYWLIKLNPSGSILWQNTLGGNDSEELYSVKQTSDGGYILGGWSQSGISGDKTEVNLGYGDYWIVKLEGESCTIPTGLFADNITATQAKAHWNFVPSADKYQLFYREIGETTWTKLIAESNFKNIDGLSPEINYEFKVRTKCDGENTSFSPLLNFTTLPLKAGEINPQDVTHVQFIIYPNPSNETITISLVSRPLITDYSLLILTNISGKIITQLNIISSETEVNVSNFPTGIYFVRMIIDGEQFVKKLIIE